MAKKPTKAKSYPTFSPGDRVRIGTFGHGRISSFFGNLGPGGEPVYRVRFGPKPSLYTMALASQLRLVKPAASAKPAEDGTPSVGADAPSGV